MPRRDPPPHFDPEPYRNELVSIIHAIEALPDEREPIKIQQFDRILRLHPRDGVGFFSRSQLLEGFRRFAASEDFRLEEVEFARRVRVRRIRSLSGVTPVTVLTQPYPCPGKCVFCPNDVRMPKSYLSDEPGAQRAADNEFDPYRQAWSRLAAYRSIGHPTDKVELIILGGTWSFYPEAYQRWFITRLFDALNDFGAGIDGRMDAGPRPIDFEALPARLDGRQHRANPYNQLVRQHLVREGWEAPETGSAWESLEAAQLRNETAASRCVGLVVETRPDAVTLEEVERIRRLGATKVQLGIQSLDDAVLHKNQRGHDTATTHRALRLLRRAGFKLHAHWMPNLLGATPASDRQDFARLFEDERVRPDELKIYPCSLVESAELVQHYEAGAWGPYAHQELLDLLVSALAKTPRWCRLTRVIRDISSDDILVGNKLTNFRELAQAELARRGLVGGDIRAREVRGQRVDAEALALRETRYDVSGGTEHFLEFVTPADELAAFLRLFLPEDAGEGGEVLEEVVGCALIRELHVYGEALPLGSTRGDASQHRGLGRRLLAEARARSSHLCGLAVISAVGTRDYYRQNGFRDGVLYQHDRRG
jgi:elongator complex protein 3